MMDYDISDVSDLFMKKLLWFDSNGDLDCSDKLSCGECTCHIGIVCGVSTKADSIKIMSELMNVTPEVLI